MELTVYSEKIMKNKILLSLSIFFLIFCFVIFFKGLNNSNIYVPDSVSKKPLINFNSQDLFSNKKILSDQIFTDSEFYILNIWASWCLPCRKEHPYLMEFNQRLYLVWKGFNGTETLLNMITSSDDGSSWSSPMTLLKTEEGSDHPMLVKNSESIHLSWHSDEFGYVLLDLNDNSRQVSNNEN